MKIDLHSHVKISKQSKFMPDYFCEMMEEAKANGLTALAMTEHFNTSRYTDIYEFLDQNYTYINDYYEINGLKLFPGIEVDVKEIGHILLIGNRNDILSIEKELIHHKEEENFISYANLLDLAEMYNVLKIGAHPFRKSTPLYHIDLDQLKRLDAFDLNGKDLYSQGEDPYKEKLEQFANKVGIPIVGGSDTHHFLQYGSVINELNDECHTIKELKNCISNRQYKINVSPCLTIKVRSAKLVKKMMKKMIGEEMDLTL